MDSFYWYVTEFEGQGGGVREIWRWTVSVGV